MSRDMGRVACPRDGEFLAGIAFVLDRLIQQVTIIVEGKRKIAGACGLWKGRLEPTAMTLDWRKGGRQAGT
jgi:hypothetical protein